MTIKVGDKVQLTRLDDAHKQHPLFTAEVLKVAHITNVLVRYPSPTLLPDEGSTVVYRSDELEIIEKAPVSPAEAEQETVVHLTRLQCQVLAAILDEYRGRLDYWDDMAESEVPAEDFEACLALFAPYLTQAKSATKTA